MNTAYVTSTPVIMESSMPEHPVKTHSKLMRGIGITGILIGLYAIGFGIYSFQDQTVPWNIDNNYYLNHSVYWMMVGAGIWFVVSGILAVAAAASATSCHIVGGIVVAILASLAAFGLLIREVATVVGLYNSCLTSLYLYIFGFCGTGNDGSDICGATAWLSFAHTLMLILAFIEFVLVIVQASYSCRCCGRTYTPTMHIPAAMTVTTTAYGKGYAPLHNEQDGTYPAAYQPPQNLVAPPSYY